MRWIAARVVACAALAAGFAACTVTGRDGCIIGPCATSHGGDFPVTLVTGFPSARVSGSTGILAPGDTVWLSVVRVRSSDPFCAAGDTLRDSVRWASTDPGIATITAMPGGQALVEARAAGSFHILMLIGGTTPLDPALPPQSVTACPGGGLVADFQVRP